MTLKDIKKSLDDGKCIMGAKEAIKNIKTGKVSKVFVSKDCPKEMLDDLTNYSNISKIELVVLDKTKEDLGVLCKKPFSISVLSILN